MNRFGFFVAVVLGASQILDAGLLGRSTAKKEYEKIVSDIQRIPKNVVYDQWRPIMKSVDAYAQKYGAQGARDRWTDELELFTGIFFNKSGFDAGQKTMLHHQIQYLSSAILELQENIRAPRENRYALELYKALFEKLRDATSQQVPKGSAQSTIKEFFGNGTFGAFAPHIINKSPTWKLLRKQLSAGAPADGKRYEEILNDIERSLTKYNALYLELKPSDRSADENRRAKDILRRLAANIEILLETNAQDPAFKIYGSLLAGIHSGLIAQIALEHK